MSEALTALGHGLLQTLAWPSAGFLAAGVLTGYVIGLLPGIGGPMAMALMLPVAFSIDTVPALALLMGVAAAAVTAGELTSILIGVPGESSAAAMLLDGHQMSRRGEAGRAAGAAAAASLAGGVFGAIVLGLLLPLARPLFSAIASPELLMLALAGLGLVAALGGDAPMKGVVAGLGGIFLATVGLDPSEGVPRFTFGQLFLWDGIGLVVAALGLFAIPEALALLNQRRSPDDRAGTSGVPAGLVDVVTHWRLVLRSSLLGVGVGILPGVGATVSQWLAYAQAAHASPRRAQFGTGEVEGVIGPAAAGNATLGGDMVPTLALGIPGSVPTAIVLGAIVLKGVTPGPGLLMPDADGGQLSLVFAFVWMIVLGNAAAAAVSLLFLDRLSAVARVPGVFLFPIVMTVIPLGVYAERHAAGDILLVAVLGAIGWYMTRHGWPRAPMLLGLVLGSTLERRWLLAERAFGLAWIIRPGVLLLAAVALLVVWRGRRALTSAAAPATRHDPSSAMVVATACAAGLVSSASLSGAPAVMPRLALGAALLMSTVIAMTSLRRQPIEHEAGEAVAPRTWRSLAWFATFLLGPMVAGFPAAAAVSSALYLRVQARFPWPRTLVFSALAGAAMLVAERFAFQGSGPGWL